MTPEEQQRRTTLLGERLDQLRADGWRLFIDGSEFPVTLHSVLNLAHPLSPEDGFAVQITWVPPPEGQPVGIAPDYAESAE